MTGEQPQRNNKLREPAGSIAAKLYCFAFLSLLAVGSLSIASIYFSRATETAAQRLYGDSFLGVLNSTRLELLLANHRRIVESMPPEGDRDRLYADHIELDGIKTRLLALIKEIGQKRPVGETEASDAISLEHRIAESLPSLFEAGEQVAFYANEFAQDKAVEQANDYAHVANGIELLIKEHRSLRTREAQQAVEFVGATAKSLMVWVLLSALVAIVLIGPIGLTTMHRALFRLRRITQAMIKLARSDTTTPIPSREDRDEVGEMARAVEGFKDNA